jgi:WhiB family redox-sensing transcriptional regulator
MEIKHHRVMEKREIRNRGKGLQAFKLRWNPELTEGAACKGLDVELFYPDKDIFSPEEERIFARMCAECPVMEMCLEWGLVHEKSGVWGGTTPFRRQAARRAMNLQVTDPRGISPTMC